MFSATPYFPVHPYTPSDDGLEELDSELDSFLAEIDDIEQNKMEDLPPEPDLIVWRECLDETTKHPYYWDAKTQEVTWVRSLFH